MRGSRQTGKQTGKQTGRQQKDKTTGRTYEAVAKPQTKSEGNDIL